MTEILDTTENKEAIEQLISQAKSAKEPGTFQGIIHQGNETVPMPMVSMKPTSAGYVYIYDNVTGERSITNRNMLPIQLKKRRPDGTTVFTTVDPKIKLKRGGLKCLLHPDGPDRDYYNHLGLSVCEKSNLTSPFQVTRHMQKRHKMEWETIEAERKEEERKEDKEFKKLLLTKAFRKKNEDTPKRKYRKKK